MTAAQFDMNADEFQKLIENLNGHESLSDTETDEPPSYESESEENYTEEWNHFERYNDQDV